MRLVIAGDVLSAAGDITLLATQSVDKTAAAQIATPGSVVITAVDGLRIVDVGSATAAGSFGREFGRQQAGQ